MTEAAAPLLRLQDVSVHFAGGSGRRAKVRAVDGVSLEIRPGETVGLVGESGSGKTTLGRVAVGLLAATSGQVEFEGGELPPRHTRAARSRRRHMQMVFQNPFSSLNPTMTVRQTLAEPLRNFGVARGAEAEAIIRRTTDACGLPVSALDRYPGEFSGGQRQRIGIARAIILRPKFIVADEPVSALDVSIQAQIVNLMQDLKTEFALTYLFIAHDLAVVKHVSDRIAVMYRGRLVEVGAARQIYATPRHPYTELLLQSAPIPDPVLEARRVSRLPAPPTARGGDTACPFAHRCGLADARCAAEAPALLATTDNRRVACHHRR